MPKFGQHLTKQDRLLELEIALKLLRIENKDLTMRLGEAKMTSLTQLANIKIKEVMRNMSKMRLVRSYVMYHVVSHECFRHFPSWESETFPSSFLAMQGKRKCVLFPNWTRLFYTNCSCDNFHQQPSFLSFISLFA